MKKIAIALLALLLFAVLLCGCSFKSGGVERQDYARLLKIEEYSDCVICVDTKTGCEYLIPHTRGWSGMVPVLNPDGTPVLAPNFDAREDRP